MDLLLSRRDGPVVRRGAGAVDAGTFLRCFTFGHVRQLDGVAARLLARLAAHSPVLPDAGKLVLVDLDDTVRQTYGNAKQGAGRGYTGIKGLNALLAVISTPLSAPLIAATPAPMRVDQLRARRGETAGRCAGHCAAGRRGRAGPGTCRLGLLRL